MGSVPVQIMSMASLSWQSTILNSPALSQVTWTMVRAKKQPPQDNANNKVTQDAKEVAAQICALPKSHPDRAKIVDLITPFVHGIMSLQYTLEPESGTWDISLWTPESKQSWSKLIQELGDLYHAVMIPVCYYSQYHFLLTHLDYEIPLHWGLTGEEMAVLRAARWVQDFQ